MLSFLRPSLALLSPALVSLFLVYAPALRGDEVVRSQLLALFERFDEDKNGVLAPAEQEAALAWVAQRHGANWEERAREVFRRIGVPEVGDGGIARDRWVREVEAYGRDREDGPAATHRVEMRDGIRLATDVYLPEGEGPFPALLLRTPYSRVKRGGQSESFLALGLAVIVQDMRGRFDSEGRNLPFIGCGWGQHWDGVDTVAWIREQAWCDGKVATFGGSAGGITQNFLAAAAPEGLVAQYILVAEGSLHRASSIGGALRKADVENWTTSNRFDPEALDLIREHRHYDDYWRGYDSSLRAGHKDVPAVHVGGWFDVFAQGTVEEFRERQHRGGPGSRGRQKLVMGPWAHAVGRMPVGELSFPDAAKARGGPDPRQWFEHWLLGRDNGVDRRPAVAYYTMGAVGEPNAPGNEWRHAEDWPPPAAEKAFHLAADGRLSTAPPAGGDAGAFAEYTFDPGDPCPTVGGQNLTLASGPRDQRPVEAREDVLIFTTAPLEHPLEATGPPRARVFVSSSAPDTDLSVRLCDVYPDGRSLLITEGMLRLRYRDSLEAPVPLAPGEIVEVEIPLWDTSIVFNRGHRIRLTVTSSNYPRFDINPGTGRPWSDEGERIPQTNRIFCDPDHPSRLVLPVVAPGRDLAGD